MIPIVQENSGLRNVNRLDTKVVQVMTQHFKQALVIRHIGFSAVAKKGEAQSINCQMSFNAIGAFVMAEPLGLNTGIASVFHRLRVDDQQPSPSWFFWRC